MGTIYKCDKCQKIIKDDKEVSFSISSKELFDNSGFPRYFHLCEKCLGPFVNYVKRFLKIKKNNK